MKKLLIGFVLLGVFLVLTSEKNLTRCKKLIENNANKTEYEYYSSLSTYYYGSPEYWEELSLINNGKYNVSEENLIIPTLNSINKLKDERSVLLAHVEIR